LAEDVLTLLGAVFLDLLFGEPPGPLHPVVWMGHWLDFIPEVHKILNPWLISALR